MNKETYDYIIENIDADVRKLALKGSKNTLIDLPFALQQIEGRQKIIVFHLAYFHTKE